MKYIDADLLRKEIERRLKYTHDWLRGDEKRHTNQTFISKNYYKMKGDERTLDALLNFLDTLSEEPDKSLEEAAENYIAPIENDEGLDYINFNGRDIKDAFIAGAEWQYQKDREEFAKIKAKTWCEGFDAHKQQMLKDAVETTITTNLANRPVIYLDQLHGFEYGDKVRIVVLKAEEGRV